MASAAVYAACRRRRLPRFLDEVAEAARVDRGKVRLAYGVLNRELSLRIPPAIFLRGENPAVNGGSESDNSYTDRRRE
jgi:transcription initiation factor TFIIIB Brf1 subunit/transcription initiation factor TFIIB